MATFSSSPEDPIVRELDFGAHQQLRSAEQDLDDFYDLVDTANEILEKGYTRIALQFPDELLNDSVPIYKRLNSLIRTQQELYVLADTSYGSCCVDEVAAQHVDADAIVHFGHACMSQTSRIPVIYVFGKLPLDIQDLCTQASSILSESPPKVLIIRHDVVFEHQAPSIVDALRAAFPSVTIVYNPIPKRLYPSSGPLDVFKPETTEETFILYIGSESLGLTNLLMTHSSIPVYSYHPGIRGLRLQSSQTNKLLMRRYAMVQKTRDADVFGILVGTLGVASYLPLLTHLRNVLALNGKKSYTMSVGKINPAKLANFMEVECWVLVACPENSLIESKEFYKPIVTPFELSIALLPEPEWTGKYILNFGQVLSESKDRKTQVQDSPERPHFSLVTGKYKHSRQFGVQESSLTKASNDANETRVGTEDGALIPRAQGTLSSLNEISAAVDFLNNQRTYRGLETRSGLDPPSILEQGRSGWAGSYASER